MSISNMWRAASRLSSINYEMGNQYLKFTYRLQLVLVKTLYDLNMRLGFENMGGICGINQKNSRLIQTSFKQVLQRVWYHHKGYECNILQWCYAMLFNYSWCYQAHSIISKVSTLICNSLPDTLSTISISMKSHTAMEYMHRFS